jgi:hypothetical protein
MDRTDRSGIPAGNRVIHPAAQVKAAPYLIERHPTIAGLASISLVTFLIAAVSISLIEAFGLFERIGVERMEMFGAVILGSSAIAGFLAMVTATFHLIRARRFLVDWGLFLAICWFIPYLGVALFLGGPNLVRGLRRRADSPCS